MDRTAAVLARGGGSSLATVEDDAWLPLTKGGRRGGGEGWRGGRGMEGVERDGGGGERVRRVCRKDGKRVKW